MLFIFRVDIKCTWKIYNVITWLLFPKVYCNKNAKRQSNNHNNGMAWCMHSSDFFLMHFFIIMIIHPKKCWRYVAPPPAPADLKKTKYMKQKNSVCIHEKIQERAPAYIFFSCTHAHFMQTKINQCNSTCLSRVVRVEYYVPA